MRRRKVFPIKYFLSPGSQHQRCVLTAGADNWNQTPFEQSNFIEIHSNPTTNICFKVGSERLSWAGSKDKQKFL